MFTPGADLGDYLRSTDAVLDTIDDETRILPAHTGRPPVKAAPLMTRADVTALHAGLRAVQDRTVKGSGIFPRRYPINDRMAVFAGFPWQR